jgi:hypothetical protein
MQVLLAGRSCENGLSQGALRPSCGVLASAGTVPEARSRFLGRQLVPMPGG